MAKIKIKGADSGSAVYTLTTGTGSTDRTINLPDATATIATTTDVAARLPSITDGGNATAITIDSNENVGIGRAPTADLDLYKSGQDVELKIEASTASTHSYYTMRNNAGKQLHMRLGGSGVGGTTWAGVTGANQASIEAQDVSSFTIGTHVAAPIHIVQARSTKAISIDTTGAVTMPAQPKFKAKPNVTQSNIAVGSEVTVVCSEQYDVGGNFASNTFTAPVTGHYAFNISMRLDQVDSASSYYALVLKTSNRDYHAIFDPDFGQDAGYWSMTLSALADMDANDTAYVYIYQANGTAQTDIEHSYSHWTGFLAC